MVNKYVLKCIYCILFFTSFSCIKQQHKTVTKEPVSINSIAPDRGLADPHVIIVNDTLYTMCGHDKSWDTYGACVMDRWELWSTTNLMDWEHHLNILPTQTYIGDHDNCFAGDVATKDGKFYWYFSNRTYSTGVMVAPSMKGPWKDALGKPLLPKGLTKTKSYDPEVFEDHGKHYIIFGAGQYYIATLGDDMISLADKPQKLSIMLDNGKRKPTGDKPTIFKRNEWYYLFWGNQYGMSKTLHGPYSYKGEYLDGGHGSAFEWEGQWYSIQENHETNAFYRGVQLRPLYFNEDGTVKIPEVNLEYPLPGRVYNFAYSTQGWQAKQGTNFNYNKKEATLFGKTTEKGAIITSTPYLHSPIYLCKQVRLKLKKHTPTQQMKLALYSYENPKRYTKNNPHNVDWSQEEWLTINTSNTTDWQEIIIPLSDFKKHQKYLHQIALQPAAESKNTPWEVKSIIVE
ncbi:family 43 glycosylhydrolase [Flammeovirga sp. EKP202]|uniref:family 43 glycosylhydrolase n=1 Tax=Flammeovirga sp. EKP202 TaxID=2770592 RepID=UPI00165F3116|nr:family 43 glycosylhydrolase [Flammeovirga sp. EKP202]MBD0400644.1 family 43 glycosylhydrolase [Flammeovirga sp. EKP202]